MSILFEKLFDLGDNQRSMVEVSPLGFKSTALHLDFSRAYSKEHGYVAYRLRPRADFLYDLYLFIEELIKFLESEDKRFEGFIIINSDVEGTYAYQEITKIHFSAPTESKAMRFFVEFIFAKEHPPEELSTYWRGGVISVINLLKNIKEVYNELYPKMSEDDLTSLKDEQKSTIKNFLDGGLNIDRIKDIVNL